MGASFRRLLTPDSKPSPSQTEYAVESGRMQAAKIDALNRPALNSNDAYSPNGRSPSAASAASLISRGDTVQIAPAHATMMKNAITDVITQPTITSMRDSA